MCEHKWVYQMSDYIKEKSGYYNYDFSRIDTYYCEKCCTTREVVAKKECRDIRDSYPSWWRSV